MDSGFTATQEPMPAMVHTVFFNPCNHDNFLKILKYHKVTIILHREQIKQEVTHQKGLLKMYMIWKTPVIGYIYSIRLLCSTTLEWSLQPNLVFLQNLFSNRIPEK